MDKPPQPEAWLRGAVDGIEPMLMPVAHALIQAREDIQQLATRVPASAVWERPGDAASIGFHVRHLGGALDRLLTYARGETLSEAQRAALKEEGAPGNPPASLADVVRETGAIVDRALDQLRATSPEQLLEPRRIGRAELPSNVLGLLFHAAEHCTRHAGQAITTAKILGGSCATVTPP
jgi:uncharacterized damage-inducible protein DinB